MAHWDVFHGETLELERSLSTQEVRAALAAARLRDDDLARPAGTNTAWLPISQIDQLITTEPTPNFEPSPVAPPSPKSQISAPRPESMASTIPLPDWFELGSEPDDVSFPVIPEASKISSKETTRPEDHTQDAIEEASRLVPEELPAPAPVAPGWIWEEDDDEDEEDSEEADAIATPGPGDISSKPGDSTPVSEEEPLAGFEFADSELDLRIVHHDSESPSQSQLAAERSSMIALPVVASRDWEPSPLAEIDEEEEETFSFARSATNKVEELDLAPMVDVAFQLVLFFMVTATTVLYKTLEVPKPSAESPPEAVAQGRSKSLDDMRDDFIVVEIDASGTFQIDREPVVADLTTLVDRLRSARDKTARLTMLLSTDYATPHRFAVLAIDAANEIGLRIAVARPPGKQAATPAPTLFPINPPVGQPKREGRETSKGS